jgi:hypothetical protein
MIRHILYVMGLLGLPHQKALWAVGSETLLGEEVGVSGRDNSLHGQESGVAMIRMEPVLLPWVVAEDHLWLHHPNDLGYFGSSREVAAEFPVHPMKEMHLPDGLATVSSQSACSLNLFNLAARC